ncbi:UbiA prenyltransferase family [Trametes meyenii]|nr:UbiA prenyltransferase family [Trametes meyenii]
MDSKLSASPSSPQSASGVSGLGYNLYTLYLFTKSDMKTILFPITLFAWYSSPNACLASVASAFFWTWLHLLQFCVSNQVLSPGEDASNKPWRPIPSGRITLDQATTLRWLLLPTCLLLSAMHRLTAVGMIFALGVLLHNEMKLDSHWFTRNVLNALGYAVFDSGATAIAQKGLISALPPTAILAHYLSIGIILTTIHAQDFQDEAGDRVEKRHTIPIVMPHLGRLSMPVGLMLWSIALAFKWSHSLALSLTVLFLGAVVGGRFYFLRTPQSDKASYVLYNVWLGLARIAPIH